MPCDPSPCSDGRIEPLDPPADSAPGDRVFAEGYDKMGGESHVTCLSHVTSVTFCHVCHMMPSLTAQTLILF